MAEWVDSNGRRELVIDGQPHPLESGHLLEHAAGHVWLTERAWDVELTTDHVRATERHSGQRLEWDRWQVTTWRITVDGDTARVEPLVM